VCYLLAKDAVTDWRTILTGVVGLLLLFTKKINSAFIFVGGAITGFLLSSL
jgi:chromate transporter